ncbi:MAG: T9SS type A sorting domain-containing protein, partial [Bacteroidales bacterium]
MGASAGAAVLSNWMYNFYAYRDGKGYLWYIKNIDGAWKRPEIIDGFSFEDGGYLDKKFGTFTFPSTHNSYIAPPMFINGNNSHDEEVPYQLSQGIRFIELDINKIPFPFNVNVERSVAIEHGKIYGGTVFGQRNVRYGLAEITQFLDSHPNEIIILKIDSPSGVPYDDIKYFFTKYGIYNRLYMGPRKDYTNMTPRDILKAGKQILLIGGDSREMASGIEALMNNSTSWGNEDINNMNPVCHIRDVVSNPLYIIAMYGETSKLGFGSTDRDRILNEYDRTKDYFLTGWRGSALRPTSFVFDYSTYGDVFEVVHEMNKYYNSVRGTATDANGNYFNNVKYRVSYSSDGKTVEAVARGTFDFPVRRAETVTITPILNGVEFSPSFYTYTNNGNQDASCDFTVKQSNVKSANANGFDDNDFQGELGVQEKAYPNPFVDNLSFTVNNETASLGKVEIFNIKGSIVFEQNLGVVPTGRREIKVNVSDVPSGAYIYKVSIGGKTINGEVIKK